jgi:hypothetical protein
LNDINLIGTFVYFFDAHNIRVVQLTHDENFGTQLPQTFFRINETEIQALDGILDTRRSMYDQSDNAADA